MQDFICAETYRYKYFDLSSRMDGLFFKVPLHVESFEKRKFKLPKTELKKFSGDAKEYLIF